ncbi:MAG: cytochrome P460 family protein [Proteobacteria bacterium]|nr:cytochrome P460 family protein [Pseudomonadota bacterium]
MKTRTSIALATIAGAVAGSMLALGVQAGGDKVAFRADYAKDTLYGTVDRYDIKQYRELWATPAAVEAARKGAPIPSGTVLTMVQYKAQLDAQGNPAKDANGRFMKGDLVGYALMEKRAGWGTEYPDDTRNGEWEYQAFKADKSVNATANLKNCFTCHKPHAGQDFVISLASLKGTKPGEAARPSGAGVVAIGGFKFGPETVSVAPGAAVTFVNTDASPHQISVTGPKPQRSAVLLKGQEAKLSFAEAGIYDYICGLHPSMKGKIEVK